MINGITDLLSKWHQEHPDFNVKHCHIKSNGEVICYVTMSKQGVERNYIAFEDDVLNYKKSNAWLDDMAMEIDRSLKR